MLDDRVRGAKLAVHSRVDEDVLKLFRTAEAEGTHAIARARRADDETPRQCSGVEDGARE